MANVPPIKVFWFVPPVVLAARVNMPSGVTYPIQDITYDGVTTGAYTDCHADMFFTLGSAAGLDDYGRGRLRAAPTATTLKVGRSSEGYEDGQLSVVDNAYITVYFDFRVHAKIPVIGGDYNEYKDADIAVGDLTEEPPPIANLGGDCARSIDATSETITVFFPGSNSLAVADGATITSYAWEVAYGSGTFVNSTVATDDDVYIEFTAGVHWVRLTVTDSNGKTNTGHRLVLADDPAATLCIPVVDLNITRNQQGATARFRLLGDLARSDYPDGGHILIWEDRDPAIFGEPDPSSRAHMRFVGWHQTDDASSRAEERYLNRATTLTCVDVLGRMDSLPGFPQRIEVPDDLVGLTWGEMPAANMDKFLCYLLHWHSTADGVADFYPSGTWAEYPFVLFDAAGATLYEQLQRQANRIVPDYNFTCDRFGAMRVVANPQFQNVADRTATVTGLTYQGISEISFGYQRPPRVHWLRGNALLTQTEWVIDEDDEKQLLTPVFAIAPGTAPGQGGQEASLGERLAKSQADLNDCVGHHYARMNARYGDITVTLNNNSEPWGYDPAAHTWVELSVPDIYAPQRGMDFDPIRCLPKEVTIEYNTSEQGTTYRARLTLERETVGLPALTEETEAALPVGEQPIPTVPPDSGLVGGQELLAAIGSDGYRYKTTDFQTPSGSGGPTYTRDDLGIAATIYSFVVDPFSPGYAPGAVSGAVNGWVVNDTDIYRVTDLHGTTIATSVHTFAVATSGAALHWRTIQASFGAYFLAGSNPWLICVSYYGDTVGHTGTWVTYSVNGGATWSAEVQISAGYDPATPPRRNPVAVWASPRTPGKAMSAAYVTLAEDPAEPLPHWGVWNETTLDLEEIVQGGAITKTLTVTSPSGAGVVASDEIHLVLAPPATAVRVELHGHYISTRIRDDTGGAFSQTYTLDPAINTGQTEDLDFTPGVINGAAGEEEYDVTWTKTGGSVWQGNRDDLPTMTDSDDFSALELKVTVNTTGTTTATNTLWHRFVVTEIELANGHIYTPLPALTGAAGFMGASWGAVWTPTALIEPEAALAGGIYLPWDDNSGETLIYHGALTRGTLDTFALMRSAGGVLTDISPTDAGVTFGVNHVGFPVRSYDNDRQKMALGGIGNSTSSDEADDLVGLWVSSNAGTAWTNILAPVAASNALYGLQIAFGADDSDVLFAWGGWSNSGSLAAIYYSSDFGATLDSREGNINSLGTVALIGIAGGPA